MVCDLPAELWLEILSYLPRIHARKLLGMNRFLTEMLLDEKYHSLSLENGFQRVVSRIQHITEPMYAQRIRRLYIYSHFIAYSPEGEKNLIACEHSRPRFPSASWPPTLSTNTLSKLGKWLKGFVILPCGRRVNFRSAQPKVLVALRVALPYWRRLEEINLILHAQVLSPTFSDFLIDLWSQRGPSIRTLNVDGNIQGLLNFLEIYSTRLAPFPNLEYLSMKLLALEKYAISWSQIEIGNKIAAFIQSHKHSLHTLIISEPVFVQWVDTPTLIQGLGCLPKLKKIELPVLMQQSFFSRLE